MARFLSSGIRLFAIALLIATFGCDRDAPSAQEIPPPSGDVLPCFPEWGPVAFVVNGVPVPEKTVERFAGFYKDLGVAPEDKAKAVAIDDAILMTAAVYAECRDQGRLAEWSSRTRAVQARLKSGEDFNSVAKTASDSWAKDAGADLGGAFRRNQKIAPLSDLAFDARIGEPTEPVVTNFGAHILLITDKIDGSSPEADQRKGAHILLAFDPTAVKDLKAYGERCQKLKKEAHVDSIQEPYKKLIPSAYRK